jgi:hydroxymethylglutaryl-CoA lyase
VSPKWVPQMAASDEVLAAITRMADTTYSALTPNLRGFDDALRAGVDEVAVFGAASESFSQKNINCSIAESLERFAPVMDAAAAHGVRVRGYVSCVIACPYEGPIAPEATLQITEALLAMGCFEVSLGDTIGVGTPGTVSQMLDVVCANINTQKLAIHCHDTYGQALANILTALQYGLTVVDSSVAGLGGCPYAKGASGNVATEDVVYMLEESGIHTGIDLNAVISAGNFISHALGRGNQSSVARARSST